MNSKLNREEKAILKSYEDLLYKLEDMELNAIADARVGQKRVKVELDDL